MPTIDFYLTTEIALENCYKLVCRLVDKAYQQKQSVYVAVESADAANTLDDLLWTFRDDGFIPHGLYPHEKSQIHIGHEVRPNTPYDILINLTTKSPTDIQQFRRVLEIVPQTLKEKARQKYRFYRDQQCEITTHDLIK